MSLFPAYAEKCGGHLNDDSADAYVPLEKKNLVENAEPDWTCNSSFQSESTLQSLPGNALYDSSSDNSVVESPLQSCVPQEHKVFDVESNAESGKTKRPCKERHRTRKSAIGKTKKKAKYEKVVEDVYFEDKSGEKAYIDKETLPLVTRPYYFLWTKSLGFVARKRLKKTSSLRYHARNIDKPKKVKKEDYVIKRETVKKDVPKDDVLAEWRNNLESEQRSKIKEYNERLSENPNDIDLWLSYIEFQDSLDKFPQNQLRLDNRRATVQRNLSIVEKALEKNRGSTKLLKLKLRYMGELLPADDLSVELQKLISNDAGNLLLWETLIMVNQGSVAMCTVRRILGLYSKFFGDSKQVSRVNSRAHDDKLLTMLYRCLIFLRQSGLWEQMWEIICLNLCLNANAKRESLAFEGVISDKKVVDMEEVILVSKLPLNQLWLRTELLRERCNWIGVSRDHLELIGDSRRFVLPEDVTDYVHPMLMRGSSFRMALYFLLSLKVPLLPTRDYALTSLGLKDMEWGVDSAEVLLPFAYPSVGLAAGRKQREQLLVGVLEGEITSGPQYLKFHPAQETYVDFLRKTFHAIADCFSSLERTSVYVWWLRFERLLIFVSKDDPLKTDPKRKKLKTVLKDFLKKEENRCNLHFYREYALIEKEMGKLEDCVKILETAIKSQDRPLLGLGNDDDDDDDKAALASLYRTLIEVILEGEECESQGPRVRKIFEGMIAGRSEDTLSIAEEHLRRRVEEFLEKRPTENEEDTFFLPNVHCDTIMLYVYLLYAKNNDIHEVLDVLDKCLAHSEEQPHLREMLHEGELSLLHLHEERNGECASLLRRSLDEALALHPDNFYLLSILSSVESESPFWKLSASRAGLGLWRAMVNCLTLRRKMSSLWRMGNEEAAGATLNKLLSLHRALARLPEVRSCPLLWRMYMLLLREKGLCERKGDEAYHESVAQCPWARGIYVDAAAIAPHLLTQIQDVIREKELRMHVTPEELDILRE